MSSSGLLLQVILLFACLTCSAKSNVAVQHEVEPKRQHQLVSSNVYEHDTLYTNMTKRDGDEENEIFLNRKTLQKLDEQLKLNNNEANGLEDEEEDEHLRVRRSPHPAPSRIRIRVRLRTLGRLVRIGAKLGRVYYRLGHSYSNRSWYMCYDGCYTAKFVFVCILVVFAWILCWGIRRKTYRPHLMEVEESRSVMPDQITGYGSFQQYYKPPSPTNAPPAYQPGSYKRASPPPSYETEPPEFHYTSQNAQMPGPSPTPSATMASSIQQPSASFQPPPIMIPPNQPIIIQQAPVYPYYQPSPQALYQPNQAYPAMSEVFPSSSAAAVHQPTNASAQVYPTYTQSYPPNNNQSYQPQPTAQEQRPNSAAASHPGNEQQPSNQTSNFNQNQPPTS